jgi:predicted nucleic acid-binding protein
MLLSRLAATIDEEGIRIASAQTADLAADHQLSVYDAAYLELAIRRQLPLASRDAELNRAAKRHGIHTLL